MDDLELRLRRDADAQPDPGPPSLTAALARARSRQRRPSRVLPLAVAAGVVVIAGGAAIAGGLIAHGHSGRRPAGGSASIGTLPPHMAVRGIWIDPRRPRDLHVVIGYTAGATSCPPLYSGGARLTSHAATIGIRVDAYALGVQPPPGTDPTTLVPFATPSGGLPTSTGGPGAGDCEDVPDLPLVHLVAAVGDRAVEVNGKRVVPTELNYPAVPIVPAGYVLSRGATIDAAHPGRAVHSRYVGTGGEKLIVSYGPADQLTPTGSRTGRAIVDGRIATVYAGGATRTLTWTLPGGTALQVESNARPPLPTSELLAVARGLR